MAKEKTGLSLQEIHSFLQQFYSQYDRFVYKLAWQLNSNKEDVEDLVQEVWLRLCSKADLLITFQKERHLSYIAATVKNTAISIARKKPHAYPLEFAYMISYNESEILNAVFDRKMKIQHFQEVWKEVPPATRELLERKYILMESDKEIANNMGINPSSVRMYLTRARATAYAILAQYKDNLI